jgi:hypothetical protein
MKKDLIIGCITNYKFYQIKPWINSINQCGFQGDKMLICYNIDFDTVNEIEKNGFSAITFNKDNRKKKWYYIRENKFNILINRFFHLEKILNKIHYKPQNKFNVVVDRFYHIWMILNKIKTDYRYIITTDVKDVIFQKDPSIWLENNLGDKKIIASCESLKYKDEEWGYNNILNSFGLILSHHISNNLIFNCGVLAGEFYNMLDLFLNIYLICNGMNQYIQGGGGPDQAALNIILSMEPFKNITKITMSEEGWAAQLGTTGPHVEQKLGKYLVENTPIYNQEVKTSTGIPFVIVHQYDRIPVWRDLINKKYG